MAFVLQLISFILRTYLSLSVKKLCGQNCPKNSRFVIDELKVRKLRLAKNASVEVKKQESENCLP